MANSALENKKGNEKNSQKDSEQALKANRAQSSKDSKGKSSQPFVDKSAGGESEDISGASSFAGRQQPEAEDNSYASSQRDSTQDEETEDTEDTEETSARPSRDRDNELAA